ncbi:MAG: oligosaccharide repeat unit polymerase [Selenomonadaceae bacterium]|nr:oligosaccharide repeat unit polymerase [Selenomonadaceae bacterium]
MIDALLPLTLALVLFAALLFIVSDFDILSPAVIVALVMAFSSVLALASASTWNLYMPFYGATILFLGVLIFSLTSLAVKSKLNFIKSVNLPNFDVKPVPVILLSIFTFILAFFSFKETYELAESLGNDQGVFGMIGAIRPHLESGDITISRTMNYRNTFATLFAYVSAFAFFYLLIIKNTFRKLLLIPMFLLSPFLILTTGRMNLLFYVIYLLIHACILYRLREGDSKASRKRSLKWTLYAGGAFFALFLILGTLTGKVAFDGTGRSPLLILAHYGGASIPAFGALMELPVIDDGLIGSHISLGLYRMLSRLGFDLPEVMTFLPFLHFDGMKTNVFTAFWRYIEDFGLWGMFLFTSLLSLFYTLFYELTKSGRLGAYGIILYSSLAYPLFMFFQDERLIMDFSGTPIVYHVILLFVFYKVILKKSS